MKKLKLNLEELKVDSFETTNSSLNNKGTAKGYNGDDIGLSISYMPTCVNCSGNPTCWPTYANTCPHTCVNTCHTCDQPTCQQTCGDTCAVTPYVCGPDDPVTV
ncbi:MAG: pinensin family lanthipeptide [Ignavibacteria bacterium]|jgi:hypothetical protein